MLLFRSLHALHGPAGPHRPFGPNRGPRRAALAALLFVVLLQRAALGQERQPFSHVSVQTGIQELEIDAFLQERWTTGRSREALITTPFYVGDVEVGGAAYRFHAIFPGTPDFDAALAYGGWSIGARFPRPIRWSAGARLGILFMSFDEETFRGVRDESEFAAGANLRVTLDLNPYIGVYAGLTYLRVYTATPLELGSASAGVRITARTPEWLRGVLR